MEANGETCVLCKKIITGTVYVMMLQVGGPMNAEPNNNFCENCQLGDNPGTNSGEEIQ